MGNLCCHRRKERRKIVLLLLGLDNAGKTVAAKSLAGEDIDGVVPTIGFSVVELKYSRLLVHVFDLGGRPDFREVWPRYFVDAYGVIFVIDASDYDRLEEAKEVLEGIAANAHIRGKPILVLANKQDNDVALDDIDMIERLDLETLANQNECPTLVQTCCCATKDRKLDYGVKIGYNWIINCIANNFVRLEARVTADVEMQEKINAEERREKIERLRYLNEQEKLREDEDRIAIQERVSPVLNGVMNSGFQESPESHSDDTEQSSVVVVDVVQSNSATNLIRRQLQWDSIENRASTHFGKNKTTPLQFYSGEKRAQSAKIPKRAFLVDQIASQNVMRRTLRSAGESRMIGERKEQVLPPVNITRDWNREYF